MFGFGLVVVAADADAGAFVCSDFAAVVRVAVVPGTVGVTGAGGTGVVAAACVAKPISGARAARDC